MTVALIIVAAATFADSDDAEVLKDALAGRELFWPGGSWDADVAVPYFRLGFAEGGDEVSFDVGACVFGADNKLKRIDCVRRAGSCEFGPGRGGRLRVDATFTRAWEVRGGKRTPLPAERREVSFEIAAAGRNLLITHDAEAMPFGESGFEWAPGDRGEQWAVKRALSPDAFGDPIPVEAAKPVPAGAGERRSDVSGEFAYTLPAGWELLPLPADYRGHDVILLPADGVGIRNVMIIDQPGTSPLAELKRKYERDLPKPLRGFRLISSDVIALDGGREAIRIVHTNTEPGVAVRQVNYVLEVAGKRYFVTCTVLEKDGDRYDAAFEALVGSMTKPDAEP